MVYCWEQMMEAVLTKCHQHYEQIVSEFYVVPYSIYLPQAEVTVRSNGENRNSAGKLIAARRLS
jgi:hypothetical protein